MSHPVVPSEILDRLRAICLELPEAHEEQAWVGTRWMIRKKNFAHALVNASTDWDNVADLLTESYRLLAPKKLATLID